MPSPLPLLEVLMKASTSFSAAVDRTSGAYHGVFCCKADGRRRDRLGKKTAANEPRRLVSALGHHNCAYNVQIVPTLKPSLFTTLFPPFSQVDCYPMVVQEPADKERHCAALRRAAVCRTFSGHYHFGAALSHRHPWIRNAVRASHINGWL